MFSHHFNFLEAGHWEKWVLNLNLALNLSPSENSFNTSATGAMSSDDEGFFLTACFCPFGDPIFGLPGHLTSSVMVGPRWMRGGEIRE